MTIFLFLQDYVSPGQSALAAFAVFAIVVTIAEHKWPYRDRFQYKKQDYIWDSIILFINRVVIAPVALAVSTGFVIPQLSLVFGDRLLTGFWPTEASLWLQYPLLIAVVTFIPYWIHRALHEIDFLWRIHHLHHLPSKLTWAKATWGHPFDFLLIYPAMTVVPLALGAPTDIVQNTAFSLSLITLLNHANIPAQSTMINLIFAGFHEHECHHRLDISSGNKNYGTSFLGWDHLFGTFEKPSGEPVAVGVPEGLEDQSRFFPKKSLKLQK